MKILIVEPGISPVEKEISGSLKSMQEIVGGYIEAIYPYGDNVALVCNEEGKFNGSLLNRVLYREDGRAGDIIAGTFFICGTGEESFSSLSAKQLKVYKEKFMYPEMFENQGNQIVIRKLPATDIQRNPHTHKKGDGSR